MKKILIFAFLLLISALCSSAAIPILNSYATDNANALSPAAKSELDKALRDLEKMTNGVQFIVYIENEYDKSYSLEEYTLKIAELNKIGKKGNDNGILLYAAIKDKVYRWEVGYGVEGTLNAALLGRISRDYIVPNFKNEDYEKGILDAVDITGRILLNANGDDIVRLKSEDRYGSKILIIAIIIIVLILVFAVFIAAKSKNNAGYNKSYRNDSLYKGAATGLFLGRGRGGFGGFSGGGGRFGGSGFSGRF
ncbi:TPM domain-containing protein [Candidatus Woesearchaeota archaeon]|nr:TPM domain-containing protein [Candidatus Woesearchaeota archaeon]